MYIYTVCIYIYLSIYIIITYISLQYIHCYSNSLHPRCCVSIIWVEIPVRNGLQQKRMDIASLALANPSSKQSPATKINKETIWLSLYFIPPESRRFLEDSTIKKSNSASKRIYVDMTITSSSCSTLQRLSAASNCLPAEAETS